MVTAIIVGSAALEIRSAASSSESATWWRGRCSRFTLRKNLFTGHDLHGYWSVKQAGVFASRGLFVAAAEFFVVSGLFFSGQNIPQGDLRLAFMAVAEIVAFARTTRTTFNFSDTQSPNLHAFIDKHPGDYRIFYQRTQIWRCGWARRMSGLLALHAQTLRRIHGLHPGQSPMA